MLSELLENPYLLLEPTLDLSTLQIEQIPYGANGIVIPRHRIVNVGGSSIVHRYGGMTGAPTFFDKDEQQLAMADVIESVVLGRGMIYLDSKISFKLMEGKVVGFAMYGPLLDYFSYLTTYADFCAAFGAPDRMKTTEAYGDLMGYSHYYFGSRKCVYWDEVDSRVSLINVGAYPGNDETLNESQAND